MFSVERKSEILKLLEQHGRVEVNELAARFQSSPETIRRDLNEMEVKGLLQRTHGGAVLEPAFATTQQEFPLHFREIQRFQEKTAICRCAASFIRSGDTIFIDNSSTCLYLVQFIPEDLRATIITNSLQLLIGAGNSRNSNLAFVCLGGLYHRENLSTYGTISMRNAGDFFPNKAFISCGGILAPDRITDSSVLEVDTKRLMIERSQEVFLLADHTKFGRSSPNYLCGFDSIDRAITDQQTSPELLAPLEEAGVKVIRAEAA